MGKETYGVAIQGVAGFWGAMPLSAYLAPPKARIVALCDVNLVGAQTRAEAAGLRSKIYQHFEDLLLDDEVELVSIVTPSCYHARDAVLAMQAGKHILVEKPIATTLEGLAMLKKTVAEVKVKTMAGF